MGVDPSKSDQAIRSAVALPHGTGKDVRVIVLQLVMQQRQLVKRVQQKWFEELIKKVQDELD